MNLIPNTRATTNIPMRDPTALTTEIQYVPYSPRRIRLEGYRDAGGHRLKVYSVVFGDDELDAARFESGIETALTKLPPPNSAGGRPGLGFVILHQGRTGDYVVLCWWDHENELPTRIFLNDESGWRPAVNESFCVWDLEIMWFERSAYVETLLNLDGGSKEAYLARTKT